MRPWETSARSHAPQPVAGLPKRRRSSPSLMLVAVGGRAGAPPPLLQPTPRPVPLLSQPRDILRHLQLRPLRNEPADSVLSDFLCSKFAIPSAVGNFNVQ